MARPRNEPADDAREDARAATKEVPDDEIKRAAREVVEEERLRMLGEVVELDMNDEMRRIAREEVASLCGLVLRRLQGRGGLFTRSDVAAVFGEALRDFGATPDEPGPKAAA